MILKILCCTFLSFAGTVFAASIPANQFTYPVQEFRMGIGNTNRNIVASGTAAGDYLSSAKLSGASTEKWYLNYVQSGVFEIVSSGTGYVITNENGLPVLKADADGANQRWKISAVEKDFDGYALYYKIVSNANDKLAFTFKANSNSIALEAYTGDNYQKIKLNLNGLEGFAANGVMENGKEKAGAIGGLLGATKTVNSVDSLKAALSSTAPLTIVLKGTFDMKGVSHTRIRDNKTIVGSYSAKTLQDCHLRTNNENGTVGDEPSDNIIFRNIDFEAVNVEDRILVNIWSSRNIWFDHCTFNSKLNRNVDEVGKFIWINTPYMDYMDKKDNGRSPDYITISYCTFTNRFWTVAYGTQNSETRRDRTTLMYNKWDQCVRRTPQLGNGIAHVYNNSYIGNDNGNDQSTTQIIAGDGAEFLSENCRFQSLTGKEIAGGSADPYRDSGSYTSKTSSATPGLLNFSPTVKSTWHPQSANYGYTLLDAYNTKNTDTKVFCNTYSGAFNAYAKIKYITDSDMSKYSAVTYPCPFLKDITVGSDPVNGKAAVTMNTTRAYTLRNVNSGFTLDVAGSKAENNAAALQGSAGTSWTLDSAANGYYYFYASVGDGKTYLLDVANGKTDNGTSIGIYTDTKSDAQLFKFVANEDGTYSITTKVSKDGSCLGVSAASKDSAAIVVEWECNASADQKWTVEMNGMLVKNLSVKDIEHQAGWAIAASAKAGDSLYGDRAFTVAELPKELTGAEVIRTACDSKNDTATLATFTAGADISVYISIDSRVTTIPAWLANYEKTTLTVKSSNDVTFNVYKATFKAGSAVTLGTNGQSSGCINYIAFIAKNTEETSGIQARETSFAEFSVSLNGRLLMVNNTYMEPVRISLFSTSGKRVAEFYVNGKSNKEITVPGRVSKGLYFIQLKNTAHKKVTKVTLQ